MLYQPSLLLSPSRTPELPDELAGVHLRGSLDQAGSRPCRRRRSQRNGEMPVAVCHYLSRSTIRQFASVASTKTTPLLQSPCNWKRAGPRCEHSRMPVRSDADVLFLSTSSMTNPVHFCASTLGCRSMLHVTDGRALGRVKPGGHREAWSSEPTGKSVTPGALGPATGQGPKSDGRHKNCKAYLRRK